jgi:protein pelota
VRLLHQDTSTGLLKVRIETPSDLWRIARLIQAGERVGASTTRRDPEAPEDAPAAHKERRRVWLVVRAEQIEFHEFSRHVRVTGPIVEGPFDIGRHHTLDLVEGEEVSIQKESLSAVDRALLEEGLHARGEPRIVLAAVDWGESTIVRLQGRSITPVADVNRTIAGKRYAGPAPERDRNAYVEELLKLLLGEAKESVSLVVAGPGFLKEEIAKRLLAQAPELKSKLRVYAASQSGRAGIDELLRSGRAAEALQGSVAAEEADLVERLVTALGGGKRAAVGVREVGEALEGGAVETLLVLEDLLRDPAVAPLLDTARSARARIFIVRGGGSGSKRLEALGKIGALLRFDWASPTVVRGSDRAPR